MKYITASIIIMSMLIVFGCSGHKEAYPDLSIAKVVKDINWNDSFKNVKDIMENKYSLKSFHEIEQAKNSSGKVYKFAGGKINGLNTQSWEVTFQNDSLDNVLINISTESADEASRTIQSIRDSIKALPYDEYAKGGDEWILSEKGTPVCGIQLSRYGEGIIINISSNKFINKYTYK